MSFCNTEVATCLRNTNVLNSLIQGNEEIQNAQYEAEGLGDYSVVEEVLLSYGWVKTANHNWAAVWELPGTSLSYHAGDFYHGGPVRLVRVNNADEARQIRFLMGAVNRSVEGCKVGGRLKVALQVVNQQEICWINYYQE